MNPEKETLEQIAFEIYENASMKHLFTSKSFSLGFRGASFSIEGKEPVSNVNSLINKMLDFIVKHNKKVLIAIDEVSNNTHLKTFIQDYQIMIRNNYPVFLLMTGLSENVSALQNNKTLTFLLRAPKLIVNSLNVNDIEEKYRKTFLTNDNIKELAALTNGYAFAYQVVGYLFF